jgi:hypothetical protein
VAILSYFRDRDLTNLIVATRRSHLPAGTPVYYGGYWGTLPHPIHLPPPPHPPHGHPPRKRPPMPARRYSPIFSLAYTEFWRGREITGDQTALLVADDRHRAHHIPNMNRLLRVSGRSRYRWGLELGRRYRDRIRLRRVKHQRVVTWQFDELIAEVSGRGGYKRRQLIAGILRGLTYGRPQLGDVKLPGIVFATPDALRLARRPAHGELRNFWRTVDASCLYFVGEEYPEFTGSARRAAGRLGRWRSGLWRRGGARRSLSRKYVVGMTPGTRILPGLGGNVRRLRRHSVRNWRLAYVRRRARTGPAGIGEYNFTFENARYSVMRDTLRAVATGIRLARRH